MQAEGGSGSWYLQVQTLQRLLRQKHVHADENELISRVILETWFSSPAQLLDIKKLELDAIAMIRKSSKIHYIYEGKKLNLNKIYGMNKKRRGRSKYLLSVNVEIEKGGIRIPAKIVCVRNKKNRKDWVPFICTNPDLSEEEIIRIYGKRWQIMPISA